MVACRIKRVRVTFNVANGLYPRWIDYLRDCDMDIFRISEKESIVLHFERSAALFSCPFSCSHPLISSPCSPNISVSVHRLPQNPASLVPEYKEVGTVAAASGNDINNYSFIYRSPGPLSFRYCADLSSTSNE